jgi:hypothetical protein
VKVGWKVGWFVSKVLFLIVEVLSKKEISLEMYWKAFGKLVPYAPAKTAHF